MIFLQFKSMPVKGIKFLKNGPNLIQTASITGRGTRGGPLSLPTPFPYEEKKFRMIHRLFDNTMLRISQENAKVIIIEGPVGVGKTAFGKALAEELDMKFIPQASMDEWYILPSGYDLRQHDHELPISVQTYDHKNFCVNPTDRRAAIFQMYMLQFKFFKYVDALCHVFNTGQGVVLERSYFSDYVFMKAMYQQKYVSKQVHDTYMNVCRNTSTFFPPPHLIIYLDIPIPVVQERIRTRNFSYEQNSPALTKEYLEALEKYWKQDYLKNACSNSELLVYNWSDGGDVELVVEDIEKIDFDILRRDRRFKKWRLSREELFLYRKEFTNDKYKFIKYFEYRGYKVPEFDISVEDVLKQHEVYGNIPECKYDIGYNIYMNDSPMKILFKVDEERYRMQKMYLNNDMGAI